MTNTWRNYANKGDGVHFPYGKPTNKEEERIEMLVEMNTRRYRYILKHRWKGLLRLAKEYERLGCPILARQVRAEAAGQPGYDTIQSKQEN